MADEIGFGPAKQPIERPGISGDIPADPAATVKPDLTVRPDALALWKKHGGDTFGPRVEQVRMPLAKFAGFIDAMLAPVRASLAGAEQERDAAITRAEEAERDRDSADAGAEALEAKIATLCKRGRTCGCSYDHKDHVCMYHSPQLTAAVERAQKAEDEVAVARAKQRGLKSAIIRTLTSHEAELGAILDRAEKAEAERDAALRLLADRPGHAVAGRDFTTVACAVLAASPQPQESGDPSWVVDEFRAAADETASREEYLRVVRAKDVEIKQLRRAIRLLLGNDPSLPTTTMMHSIGGERVCLTPREYAEAFARAALAEQAPPS